MWPTARPCRRSLTFLIHFGVLFLLWIPKTTELQSGWMKWNLMDHYEWPDENSDNMDRGVELTHTKLGAPSTMKSTDLTGGP
jgi:hypothetical protein